MPDRKTISSIAKILARAGSDNQHEAESALRGAYKRMVRDGVTLADLLTLSTDELYQNILVKLVDVILDDHPDLSPAGRRDAYSEYMLLIVHRFSASGSGGGGSSDSSSGKSRQEEAEEYERRRREQERQRQNTGSPPPGSDKREYSQENSETPKRDNARPFTAAWPKFSFSPAGFFSLTQAIFHTLRPFFTRGSFVWCALANPARTLPLIGASFLYGCAFAGIVLLFAGMFHALTHTGPILDMKLKSAFSFLTAIGMFFKARMLFHSGWFR